MAWKRHKALTRHLCETTLDILVEFKHHHYSEMLFKYATVKNLNLHKIIYLQIMSVGISGGFINRRVVLQKN